MLKQLHSRLDQVMGRDRPHIERRLSGLARRAGKGLPIDRGSAEVEQEIQASVQRRQQREGLAFPIRFDPDLPISAHVEEITRALATHQVLIVAGETGSGKTTQLPKICWQAGRGRDGWIGCTQPRRIAARSISARLAEEMQLKVGGAVGFSVRFDEKLSSDTVFKVLTDGMLLAETQSDRPLIGYDTLIIDEAHERSLNIDFLLGYIKALLPRRPDLKVIITSATIDTERFSRHFHDAPIIEVSGRSYPVEMRYRSLLDEDQRERDLFAGIADAVDELDQVDPRGDILVFLPGERDIREATDTLTKRGLRNTEILPLFARLSAAEQHRIFHPGNARRIVIATNVAETSLTVPRIRFVIDSGLARISRYSSRSKVQRLPIEAISRASADQRAGRCGRLGPGTCIRLYSEEDFQQRPEFTEPEIQRTNLAAVILRMEMLGLGKLEDFDFLDAPSDRFIKDGYQLLFELGALDGARHLTRLGREMAWWPVDVRMGRLVLAGRDQDCLEECLVLAAFLSLADPRERPMEAQQQADERHQQWVDTESDFVTLLNLWRDWLKARKELSHSRQRRWCRDNFLSYMRMREWWDIRRQLADMAKESGWKLNRKGDGPATYEALHRALVTAFIGQLGLKDEREYRGERNRRFSIFPGSGLFARGPKWLVSAFLVETTRVYARINARIEPAWAEQAAEHLVKRRYYDPRWSAKSGRVVGYEQVTLNGLMLVARRRVHYGPHDPEIARELLIRDGLVPGNIRSKGKFLTHNAGVIDEVRELEERQRKRDLLVDDEVLFQFFDERLPAGIHTTRAFERWREKAEAKAPDLLKLDPGYVLMRDDHGVDGGSFPDHLDVDGARVPLEYRLAPGQADDGVNLLLPLHLLNKARAEQLEWLVPGLLREKVVALIKSLPKPRRRYLVPAPNFAADFLGRDWDRQDSLLTQLAGFLGTESGQPLAVSEFDPLQLPDHLKINVQLRDGSQSVASSRDLEALQAEWGEQAREDFLSQADRSFLVDGLTRWDFEDLPEQVEVDEGVQAWPALVDQEDAVGIRLFEDRESAHDYHLHGLRRLLQLSLKDKFRYLHRSLALDPQVCLRYASIGSASDLRDDLVFSISMACVAAFDQPVRDADAFERLTHFARVDLLQRATQVQSLVEEILSAYHQVFRSLDDDLENLYPWAHGDMQSQLGYLLYPGFLTDVPHEQLTHYPRYLSAMNTRVQRLTQDPARDRQRLRLLEGFWTDYLERCDELDSYPASLARFHWMIEEYRVSVFAQELKTAMPVSSKRLKTQWARVLKDKG